MKIKQLSKIAINIIKQYGIIHFLRVCLLEYKQNRLAILKSEFDEKRIPTKNKGRVYQDWLKTKEISSDIIRDRITSLSNKPKFGIVLYDENRFHLIKNTISSIENQNYEKYEIVFNFSKQFQDKVSRMENQKAVKNIFYGRPIPEIANSHHIEYMIFIKAGDELTNDALYEILCFINANPDAEIIYSDEDTTDDQGIRKEPFFKPDWSPELFLDMDYFSNFFIVKSQALTKIYEINEECKNKKYYDLLLRLTENNQKISHIPKILVTRTYQKEENNEVIREILNNTVNRRKLNAVVEKVDINFKYRNPWRIKFVLKQKPKISIIIPTKNQPKLLKRCINNIEKYSASYQNYEVIIIDNNNENEESIAFLKNTKHKVIKTSSKLFNFAKMNNEAVKESDGKYLLFLNDDAAPIENDWLEELSGQLEQDNIGIVGPKLVFSNRTVQHAGMIIMDTGAGFHPFMRIPEDAGGYFDFANTVRNYSAVTGACLMIKRDVFDEVCGFDEKFDVYYNDTDLCMKVTKQGLRIVYTPFTKALHEGSSSIKKHSIAFFTVENLCRFKNKWPQVKNGDPFYNPNLGWDFNIKEL